MKILVLVRGQLRTPDGLASAPPLGRHERAALDVAVALKPPGKGGVEVTALCAGPPAVRHTLNEARAGGADHLVRLWDDRLAQVDCIGIARALAAAARHLGFDLVLAGHASSDLGLRCTGPAVADGLDVPHLTRVHRIERDAASPRDLRAYWLHDGTVYVDTLSLPSLVTVVAPDPGGGPEAGSPAAQADIPTQEDGVGAAPEIQTLGLADIGLDPAVLEARIPSALTIRPETPHQYETAWAEDAATVAEHLSDLGLLRR